MSEDSHETKRDDAPGIDQKDAEETGAGETAEARAAEAEAQAATAEEQLAEARTQAAEFRERYLRAVAELENYRRRAEKERQDTARFAIAGFARDMLSMLDNLRRGLESISADERKDNTQLETLASGMELTEREMLATLERHGIVKIDPQGEPFDHNFHQAMMEIEDPSVPAGTVAQVMQAGYIIHDRLLRPAMVAVAKGGARPRPDEKVQAPIANEDVADQGPAPQAKTKGRRRRHSEGPDESPGANNSANKGKGAAGNKDDDGPGGAPDDSRIS